MLYSSFQLINFFIIYLKFKIYLMAGNSAIIYGVLFGGIVFYYFTINSLISTIKEENFNKSFLRLIDLNHDQVITKKEIDLFTPCEQYERARLNKAMTEYGNKADIMDLAGQISSKNILKIVGKCFKDTLQLNDPLYLSNLNRKDVTRQMINGYDLNNDNKISFSEHQIGNIVDQKLSPNTRQIFRFFDKNHDWVITLKELEKSSMDTLPGFLGGTFKRRKPKQTKRKH